MKFADHSPKTNAPKEVEGGLVFCSTEEGVREVAKIRLAGKLLFVTDGSALQAFRTYLPPRALCLVLDSSESLPLFVSSDDVSCIVAAGRKSTLLSARFFADVRKIPCTVFPVSAAFDGAYEKFGEVLLENTVQRVPLAEAKVCCDRGLVNPTLGQAYMRLLLSRLALIEAKALRRFGIDRGSKEAEERAYQALLPIGGKTFSFEEVALKNAEIRRCERDGMEEGEGVCLAELIGREGEEQAYQLLSALYAAFFSKGKPRLVVPDYAARAKIANVPYAAQNVPTLEEFAHRAALLEQMRAEAYRELNVFLREEVHYRNNFYLLTGRILSEVYNTAPLKILPELTAGLSSIIRDFGLMEWKDTAV